MKIIKCVGDYETMLLNFGGQLSTSAFYKVLTLYMFGMLPQ